MKRILMLFLFAGFLWSCSSDDDNGGVTPIDTSVLPVKISFNDDGEMFDVLFSYNGNKISKMNYSSNSPFGNAEAIYQYDGDKITKITFNLSEGQITKTYTYQNNRIATMKEVWEGYGTSEYTYDWISDSHVKLTSLGSGYSTDFYMNNGNIVKVEDYFGGSIWESNFSFDNQNSIFKNIEGFQYLVEEGDLYFNRNNITQEVTTAGDDTFITNYTYDYNSKGFPTIQTEESEDSVSTLVVTYNQ